MYVCNLAMSSNALLLLLFIFLGGKKSRIDRSIFLYNCRCPFYLVIYHLLLSRFVITIFLCVLVLDPSNPFGSHTVAGPISRDGWEQPLRELQRLVFPHRILTVVRSYPYCVCYLMTEERCVVGTERSSINN